MATKKSDTDIVISKLEMETLTVKIRGTTGFISNRMPPGAWSTLLIGGKKKVDRTSLKHDPHQEFVDSMAVEWDWHPFSHVQFPAVAFKKAMATAALVSPDVNKTDIQRLVSMADENIPIFGVPKLRMDIVRQAGMNRTPDVRTRAFFPEWGTEVTIKFPHKLLPKASILNLLFNAGEMCGVGDFRQEKGSGGYGAFELLQGDEDFPDALLDRDAQRTGIEAPEAFNSMTRRLLAEIDREEQKRE